MAKTRVFISFDYDHDEGIGYLPLWGRANRTCKKATTAKATDKIYEWTWDNLKKLVGESQ